MRGDVVLCKGQPVPGISRRSAKQKSSVEGCLHVLIWVHGISEMGWVFQVHTQAAGSLYSRTMREDYRSRYDDTKSSGLGFLSSSA